jgi:hypothetical protein
MHKLRVLDGSSRQGDGPSGDQLSDLPFPLQDRTAADALIASLRKMASDYQHAVVLSPSSPAFASDSQRIATDAPAVSAASTDLREVLGLPARNSNGLF